MENLLRKNAPNNGAAATEGPVAKSVMIRQIQMQVKKMPSLVRGICYEGAASDKAALLWTATNK